MSISRVESSGNNMPEIVEPGSNTEMDKLAFLNLLSVQLANQDPLDPMDSDQMAQQQVAYAELEQMINLNETMTQFVQDQQDVMLGIAGVFNTLESTNFLGKQAGYFTDKVTVNDEGTVNTLYYDLTQDAQISYIIKDQAGNVVNSTGLTAIDKGDRIAIEWDGTSSNGEPVPPGKYTIAVTAQGQDGVALTGKTYSFVPVQSVDFREGTPLLTLSNGEKLSVNDIIAVEEPQGSN